MVRCRAKDRRHILVRGGAHRSLSKIGALRSPKPLAHFTEKEVEQRSDVAKVTQPMMAGPALIPATSQDDLTDYPQPLPTL